MFSRFLYALAALFFTEIRDPAREEVLQYLTCCLVTAGMGLPLLSGEEAKSRRAWQLGSLALDCVCGRSAAALSLALPLLTRHQYILFPLAADGPSASPFPDPFS